MFNMPLVQTYRVGSHSDSDSVITVHLDQTDFHSMFTGLTKIVYVWLWNKYAIHSTRVPKSKEIMQMTMRCKDRSSDHQ